MKTVNVAAAILIDDDRVFATQRGYGPMKDGWEFPGGKIEEGETPEQALVREIKEELATVIEVDQYFDTVEWDYPDFHLSMKCFLCHVREGSLDLLEAEDAKWLDAAHLFDVDWLSADRTIISKLQSFLFTKSAKRETNIESVEKLTDNPYLNLYHLGFHDRAGRQRHYYFVSRKNEDQLKIKTHDLKPDGICIYAVTKEAEPRIALVHEYRFPIDEYIYSLPCGLIDPGETADEAAVRELKEETGFAFEEYKGGASYMRRPFFLAPGFSDEPGQTVFGTITDTKGLKENESSEWIDVVLADKKEVRRILEEEKTSMRSAFLLHAFLKSDPREPFAFLD